jgi:RHS repeat-associated protein
VLIDSEMRVQSAVESRPVSTWELASNLPLKLADELHFRPYNRMQMHLSSDVQIPDGLLAANALLAENSRQGSWTYSGTVHQSFEVAISYTSLGISNPLYDTRVESRYTGKERDTESGLDYFGARYYASSMGRWMSPDWAAKVQPVPYSKLDNPQTLNLYSYVGNNPLSRFDPDGHEVDLGTNADKGKKLILDNVNKKERALVSSVTDQKTGKTSLQIDPKAAAAFKGTHTDGFNMLSQAISSDKVIQVNVVDPKTMLTGPDGVSSPISSPTWGGGASAPTANGAIVSVSSGGGADVLGQSGAMISSPASIVMGHELLGHGLGYISVGHDGTEAHAIGVENQLRDEQGLPLREPHP